MPRLSSQLPALPLTAGALASAFIFTGTGLAAWYMALGCLCIGLIFSLSKIERGITLMATGIACAAFSAMQLRPAQLPFYDNDMVMAGTVDRVASGRAGQQIIAEVDAVNGQKCERFRCRLISDIGVKPEPGDIVRFKATPEAADKYADIPYMSARSVSDKSSRISASALVSSDEIEIIGHDKSLVYRIATLRNDLADAIYKSPLSAQSSSLLAGACLGTGEAANEIKDTFRSTGLSHLLCVSGFHIAIITWLIALILWPVKAWRRGREIRLILILAAVWSFAIFTGAQPSAVRAAVMITSYYICKMRQRGSYIANSLCLSVGVMMIYNPWWIYSIGFQLSVAAVGGLLCFSKKLNPVPLHYKRLWSFANLFTIPLGAMIGTAPVVLYWFHRLPLMSIPVNALASLLFPPFLIAAAVAFILSSTLAAHIADFICEMIMSVCRRALAIDGSVIDSIYLTPASMTALVVIVVAAALILHYRKVRLAAAGAALAALGVLEFPAARAEAEMLAMGNRHGNQLIVRRGQVCNMLSSRNKPIIDISDYLGGHRIADIEINADKCLHINGKTIGIASAKTSSRYRADILLIDGSYRGSLDDLLNAHSPAQVLIGANMADDRRRELDLLCASKNIKTSDLARKAIVLR